jgi:hypothetical protein
MKLSAGMPSAISTNSRFVSSSFYGLGSLACSYSELAFETTNLTDNGPDTLDET